MNVQMLIENIEFLSLQKGVNKTTAMQECGAGRSFVSNLSKKSAPSIEKIEQIADYFGVSIDCLLGRQVANNSQSYTDTGEISQDENKLLACFAALNDEGKEKAIERLEEMAALDKYKKGYQPYVAKEA